MLNSYPSIYNFGHAAISDLLKGDVIVEEKIDGSQFSFGLDSEGEVQCRSKGAQINMLAPEKMFQAGVEVVKSLKSRLSPGYTYRGEYLQKPKHNALAYDRTPKNHIILFDINFGVENYLTPMAKQVVASDFGLECVPEIFCGRIDSVEQFRTIIDRESCLGGQKIEGVVVKPFHYDLFGRDKKVLMGKFVSEAFREVHAATWDAEHKTKLPNDIIEILSAKYGTTARWSKAVIHAREAGTLTDSPKDIGALMAAAPQDTLEECATQIMDDLMDWAWPLLQRRMVRGLPDWYKEELLKRQFDKAA